MARPRKPINAEEVTKLAAINCSVEEISDFFGVHQRTIQRRFATALKEGRSHGRMSLKRRMWETAMSQGKGAVTMQIWLSKQMLGYSDKLDNKVEMLPQPTIIERIGGGETVLGATNGKKEL